ncbi:MAG: ATP-binding cassette domain-containing protein [Pseudomonadota bacterium]
MTALSLENLEIAQGDRVLVRQTVTVAAGEVLTIMGPSGSGKSTLLNAILGTLAPEFRCAGDIRLEERSLIGVPLRQRRVGVMFQDSLLFPHLSVGANLAFALPADVKGRAARATRVAEALEQAGLAEFADRDPETLSGGQKARVALMRTLLAEPRLLLLDEPFSKLDTDRRAQLRSFVFQRIIDRGIPALLVTHDVEDARAAGGAVVSPLGEALAV